MDFKEIKIIIIVINFINKIFYKYKQRKSGLSPSSYALRECFLKAFKDIVKKKFNSKRLNDNEDIFNKIDEYLDKNEFKYENDFIKSKIALLCPDSNKQQAIYLKFRENVDNSKIPELHNKNPQDDT
ncbi:MAG: hypothetical protein GQ534_07105 [Candidatus Delongbacteria bacterium]|nr:hypothetical protein [Candidatus Delongbacteria bacterium]